MSEVKLVLRDASRTCAGHLHGSSAHACVGALAADPVTIEELEVALQRFEKPYSEQSRFDWFHGSNDAPWDAGLVVIDLAAKLVVVDSTYSSPGMKGEVWYHNGQCGTDIRCKYQLKDDWLIIHDRHCWQSLADRRRAEFAARPTLDARAIFYGRPLLQFIATECFRQFARRDEILREEHSKWIERRSHWIKNYSQHPESERDPNSVTFDEFLQQTTPGHEDFVNAFYDTLKDIHAQWLMTPREDLAGQTPREILLADHDRLSKDMRHRCDQWSWVGECPRGLDESSHAFRFGGFGTHELVEYYELVRHLLRSSWQELTAHPPVPFGTVSDFLATEIERLEAVRDEWFDSPAEDLSELITPRQIIHNERRRIPEGRSGHETMHDPDCPCCQMLAEMPGVSFWHLDGCNMDDEFAFAIYERTPEQWEAKQREYEEMDRSIKASAQARKELGVDYGDQDKDPLWSSSYIDQDDSENDVTIPIGIRVFGIGGDLADIISQLRLAEAPQATIDELNRHFGNLRQVTGQTAELGDPSLLEPVIERFAAVINELPSSGQWFDHKTASLLQRLSNLLNSPPPQREWSPDMDEFPF